MQKGAKRDIKIKWQRMLKNRGAYFVWHTFSSLIFMSLGHYSNFYRPVAIKYCAHSDLSKTVFKMPNNSFETLEDSFMVRIRGAWKSHSIIRKIMQKSWEVAVPSWENWENKVIVTWKFVTYSSRVTEMFQKSAGKNTRARSFLCLSTKSVIFQSGFLVSSPLPSNMFYVSARDLFKVSPDFFKT